jgi:hypothetical protein
MVQPLGLREYEPTATTGVIEVTTYDILTPIIQTLFNSDATSFISVAAIVSFLGTIWTIYAILAYIAAIFFLYIYVYASLGIGKILEQEALILKSHEDAFRSKDEIQSQSARMAIIRERISSEHPDDWKLAIIEADIILDQTLKQQGYAGTSLGERLRSITTSELPSLNDAWQAHKIRNFIAHNGHEYVLTQRDAQEAIVRYERVFRDLGVS